MGRSPCCSTKEQGLTKGAWTAHEDQILSDYIKIHGEGKWRRIPKEAGLKRCGKSCRLRWLNYLRPDIKRGNITQEEEDLIVRLHKLLGNRWSLIAGRIPGRTDNEIKNYWNTTLGKKVKKGNSCAESEGQNRSKTTTSSSTAMIESSNVVAVRTRAFSCNNNNNQVPASATPQQLAVHDHQNQGLSLEDTTTTTTSTTISLSEDDLMMLDFDNSDFWKMCQLDYIDDHHNMNMINGDSSKSSKWGRLSSSPSSSTSGHHNAALLFSEEMLKDWMRDECFQFHHHRQS